MTRNDLGGRLLVAVFVSVIWIIICGILPIFAFSGLGEGSIFLAIPIWREGVAGAVLHSAAVMLLPDNLLDSKKLGMLVGVSVAFLTSADVILSGGIDVLISMYGFVFWILVVLGMGIPLVIVRITRERSANAAS